jgi:hydroxyacylglutathione hydrolase
MVILRTFPVGLLQCNCVVLGDPETREAIVVDPGGDVDLVLRVLAQESLSCRTIVNTHTHLDHVAGNFALKEATGARLMLHGADVPLYDHLREQAEWLGGLFPAPERAPIDDTLAHGDRVAAGGISAEVLHTPGHTPGSLCLHLGEQAILLCGDTLFAGSIGRTDLWGGDLEQEMASIRHRILRLEDHTRVLPGHGPETTVGEERRFNPFLQGL